MSRTEQHSEKRWEISGTLWQDCSANNGCIHENEIPDWNMATNSLLWKLLSGANILILLDSWHKSHLDVGPIVHVQSNNATALLDFPHVTRLNRSNSDHLWCLWCSEDFWGPVCVTWCTLCRSCSNLVWPAVWVFLSKLTLLQQWSTVMQSKSDPGKCRKSPTEEVNEAGWRLMCLSKKGDYNNTSQNPPRHEPHTDEIEEAWGLFPSLTRLQYNYTTTGCSTCKLGGCFKEHVLSKLSVN